LKPTKRELLTGKHTQRLQISANIALEMPRILRIINRYNIGGPTYNAAYLSKYLPDAYETVLVGGSPQPHEAHSGYILDQLSMPYREIPEMGRSIKLLDDWRAFRKICRLIREFKPDIVHTHAAKAGALGRIAARYCGVPIIIHTYHGHVFDGYFSGIKSFLVKSIERMLGKISTAIVAISPLQLEQISAKHRIIPSRKMHVIPLGFDLDRFSNKQEEKRQLFRSQYQLKPEEVAIGIIGRLTAIKQHELFLSSFALTAAEHASVRAFVIGDGERMDELKKLWQQIAMEHHLAESRLVFTSWIKEVDTALAGLDIVAMTSINEGTPVSLIEAQAAGKPVVTTNVGGVADCVDDMRSGIIVSNQSPENFAAAMNRLIANPNERQAMGRLGHAFVRERFSYQRLIQDMDTLYKMLIALH
jgi:glycosyltransferase involved in cell wall biosynthesis